jgi:hypothetical protein
LTRDTRSHQFALGDLLSANLYDLLEGLLEARYSRQRLAILEPVAARVDLLRRSRFWRSWIPASIEPLPTIRFHVGPFRQLRIRG